MDELQVQLEQKMKELTNIIERSQEDISSAPEGTLILKNVGDSVQYYHRTKSEDTHGSYIKKSEITLIKKLAQKDYARKIHASAIQERDQLIRCLRRYQPDALSNIYDSLNGSRKNLICTYTQSEEEYIVNWKAEKILYKKQCGKDDLGLLPEEDAILTEQGERVRSKSEKIVADKLFMMGIPYVYECPLKLSGYGYIKPDFTVLNARERKEYVWEHFGLMDDKEYCEKTIKKIELYEKNQMYPGRKLIVTYETERHPLNTRIIEGIVKEYLL